MRVLVAEDDRACRELIAAMLKGYGETVMVDDGQGAIDSFIEAHRLGTPFGLVCLDIRMPRKDGTEVLGEIRQFERDNSLENSGRSVVLMITGLAKYEDVKAAFKKRCDGYVVKPIEMRQLHATLSSLGISKAND